MRKKTLVSWSIYVVTLLLGLYSFLFTGFVAIGHGIYVFAHERFHLTKTFITYLIASFVSLLGFLPWLLIMIDNRSSFEAATAWSTNSMSVLSLVNYWIYNVTYVFVDFFYIFSLYPNSAFNWQFGQVIVPLVLILVIFSIYFIFRNTSKKIWLFVFTLILTTAAAIILPDIIWGGYRSIMARYFIPSYIGIQLAVAYVIAEKISYVNNWQQKLWQIITVTIFFGGVLSCTISSRAEGWWNKRSSPDNFTQIINQTHKALLITTSVRQTMILTHQLDPEVRVMMVDQPNIPEIPENFDNIFVIINRSSQGLKNQLETQKNYKLNLVNKGRKSSLYKLSTTVNISLLPRVTERKI